MIDNLEKKQKIKSYALSSCIYFINFLLLAKTPFKFGNMSFYLLHKIPDPHLDFVIAKTDRV